MVGRRHLLHVAAASVLAGSGPRTIRAAAPRAGFVGACLDGTRAFAAAFDPASDETFEIALPGRGHGFAQRPARPDEIVVFARRPGAFMIVADRRDGRVLREIAAAGNRRFCGHGVFGGSGRLLYATELVHATGDGIVGIYDAAAGYARIGEVGSGGLDPHEIGLLPDGETLVVANGGIATDPAWPGLKLNIDEMDSSLAYLRARDGALLGTSRLPGELFQLSLRHLAIAPDGTVAVVMQYEGPSDDLVPLVALQRRPDAALETIALPDRMLGRLRNYCGSVAIDETGRFLATTSPVGGVVVLWDMREGRCLGYAGLADACGLAAADGAGSFVAASGHGGGRFVAADAEAVRSRRMVSAFVASRRWDNHLMRLR